MGASAETYLSNMGVKTVHNLRVASSSTSGDQTIATLSDNTTLTTDVYIDATGGTPNAGWIPQSWLTSKNRVQVDGTTLRSPTPGVYAIGDIASYSQSVYLDIADAVRPLCSSILVDLSEEAKAKPKQMLFKQITAQTQLVPIGQKGGVWILFGWRIPSFLVWAIKGRGYFIEKAAGTVMGSDYVKA